MTFMNSAIEPGQPCVMISGSASGSGERTCMKCTVWRSISVVNCGYALSAASCARQSYVVRQYSASSLAYEVGTP